MFLKRSFKPEMTDDFSIADERIDHALNELKIINKFLGGVSTTKAALDIFLKRNHTVGELKILDIGSGSSDILISLRRKYKNLEITSIDINKRTSLFLKNTQDIKFIICGNIKLIPFKDFKFDLIHASLFLHHFREEEIKNIFKNIFPLCRHAIIVNDLRRSILALLGIKLITTLFSQSDMVKNDAPLSVKRGFTKTELKTILDSLGYDYIIKRKWAFRWSLLIYK